MSDFTLPPGPWETDPHGTGAIGNVHDADGHQLLQTQPSRAYVSDPRKQVEYRNDLARRLTAYPDLYEALKELMDEAGALCREPVTDGEIAARAALKKAESKS